VGFWVACEPDSSSLIAANNQNFSDIVKTECAAIFGFVAVPKVGRESSLGRQ
jgi:hypothetical protein